MLDAQTLEAGRDGLAHPMSPAGVALDTDAVRMVGECRLWFSHWPTLLADEAPAPGALPRPVGGYRIIAHLGNPEPWYINTLTQPYAARHSNFVTQSSSRSCAARMAPHGGQEVVQLEWLGEEGRVNLRRDLLAVRVRAQEQDGDSHL